MIGTFIENSRGMPARRVLMLEAENAQLRRLLAELSARSGEAQSLEQSLAGSETIDEQLRVSEEFNRRILAATTDCVMVLDLDGRLISMNECGLAFFGATNFAHVAGKPWAEFWSRPDSHTAVLAALDEARAGRTARFQAAIDLGRERDSLWWDIVLAPMNGEDGSPERILAVSRDITEIKQNEARQTLLMQELAHRVKNTLAMVQAVATQTLRNAPSLESAAEILGARLLALAQAHDVLMQGSWSSADLHGLVTSAIALHSDGEPGRFVVEGPPVTLAPRPGLTLALILHELGTNAAKYGALSNREGHVVISWDVAPIEGEDRFCFRWEEIGGPPVKPPTHTGFGSRLIERSLNHSFGGNARLEFPESGAVLTMQAPLQAILSTGQPGGAS